MAFQERIQNPINIDNQLIDRLLQEGNEVIVQFSEKINDENLLIELDSLCSTYNENFAIRFYGFHGESFNCGIIDKIPNVKSLYVDCLTNAHNINALSRPQSLKKLSLGIFELKETEILNSNNLKNISDLRIGDTKTKALNLEYLKGYKQLSNLLIAGHKKNINAIGTISNLNRLSLNSISKAPLDFVNQLNELKTLSVILGGRENINEIKNKNIENLQLTWIRGLNDVSAINNFESLQTLTIQDQIRLTNISFNGHLSNLNYIKIINCKTLNSLTGLESLNSLEHIRIFGTSIDFDDFITKTLPKSLDILAFYTNRIKADNEIKNRLSKLGYTDGLTDN